MKVFVATKETQHAPEFNALRNKFDYSFFSEGDFSYVPEGELVMPIYAWECLGVCDTSAGRSLAGIKTLRGTTTFRVVEQVITPEELEETFYRSLKKQGFVGSKGFAVPTEKAKGVARSFARAIMRAAAKFPVGDVVTKRFCTYQSRTHRKLKTRILVVRPRGPKI